MTIHKSSKKRIAIEQRRDQAVKMRLEGHTLQVIADTLGVSASMILKDIQASLNELSMDTLDKVRQYRGLLTARRESLINNHWIAANDPTDEKCAVSATIVERNLAGLAKLHGLDAPEVKQILMDSTDSDEERAKRAVVIEVAGEGAIDWEQARRDAEETRQYIDAKMNAPSQAIDAEITEIDTDATDH